MAQTCSKATHCQSSCKRGWNYYICSVLCLVAQSCSVLHAHMDCSPSGSSVHEVLQARILEWEAISFSKSEDLQEVKHGKSDHILESQISAHGDYMIYELSIISTIWRNFIVNKKKISNPKYKLIDLQDNNSHNTINVCFKLRLKLPIQNFMRVLSNLLLVTELEIQKFTTYEWMSKHLCKCWPGLNMYSLDTKHENNKPVLNMRSGHSFHWDNPEGWSREGGGRGIQDVYIYTYIHVYTLGGFMLMYGKTNTLL